jgi:hypothetical protein
MSTPDTRVFIAFDLAAGGVADFFTLGDPVKGVLSGGTVTSDFPLAGDILEDVTEDVIELSTRRGRSKQLEAFDAGAASVLLRNDERKFDPAAGTAITPFGASMRPRKQIIITSNGARLFTGVVEDWDLEYRLEGDHVASVQAADAFTILAQQVIPRTTNVVESSGSRVESVLDLPSIAWPESRRDISAGKATLQADIISDEEPATVLEYLQRVEISEPGALFIARDGSITFRGRDDFQQQTDFTFADNGQGLPFTDIQISYGIEEMRNRVTVERLSGGTAVAENAASIVEYGAIDFGLEESLVSTDTQAEDLAQYLANTFADPQVRIEALSVNLGSLTGPQVAQALGLELGDVVRVLFTPSGIGDQISQVAVVDSIEHEVTNDLHNVRFNLSETRIGFTLNSDELGVLDVNKLGF